MEKNLTQEFIALIKTKILNGEYGIGTPLPTLRELSELFGYSRTVVNVGIAKLVSQGYVTSKMRKMNIVNDYLNFGRVEVISDIVFSDNQILGQKALTDIINARKLIETESVRIACENCDHKDFRDIDLIIAEEKIIGKITSENLEYVTLLDCKFHRSLVQLSDNIFYRLSFNDFSEFAKTVTKQYFQSYPDTYGDIIDSHVRLVGSVKEHNLSEALKNLEVMLAGGDQRYKDRIHE